METVSELSNHKSLLATYYNGTNWYNIISVRHRNGASDGVNYGMYIRTGLTFAGNLTWGKQYGSSSWQAERTLLDSANFTSYAAKASHTHPKSQITDFPTTWAWSAISGKPTTLSGYGITDAMPMWKHLATNNHPYMKVMTIKVNASYVNTPITFMLKGRSGGRAFVSLKFANSEGKDPGVAAFSGWGESSAYYTRLRVYKAATSTWEIWLTSLSQGYDSVIVWDVAWGQPSDFTITLNGTAADSLPSYTTYVNCTTDSIACTVSGNASTASKWATARTISLGSYLSGSVSLDGSANVTLNANVLGLTNQGRKTAISGTTVPPAGLRMYEVYNNGYPCAYGNLISVRGGGAGELLLEWTGSDTTGHVRYRSKRDNSSNGWTAWGTLAFTTDNVASATKLATARTINGTSFNGTANITTANWGTARNIAIASSNGSGAGSATSVNGSANVTLKLPATITASLSGNASSATKLQTARTLWGQSFNGTGNVSGSLSGVVDISMTGRMSTGKATNTYLAGNQGQALVNSTASAGAYVMLHRGCSTNGYFTMGTYLGTYLLQYTAKSVVTAGTNNVSKSATLLNEAGDSKFPGTVTAAAFSGNASSATKLQTARTLWGQSFDGTSNVSGDIVMGTGKLRFENMGNCRIYNGSNDISPTVGGALANLVIDSWYGISFTTQCSGTYQGKTSVGIDARSGKVSAVLLYAKTGVYSDGYVSAKGQNTSSDLRLKDVLGSVTLPLERIAKAPIFRFSWKDGSGESAGSSAQYWRSALPAAVRERDGYLEMQYGNIALISAVAIARETLRLASRVSDHERRIRELEAENRRLRAILAA